MIDWVIFLLEDPVIALMTFSIILKEENLYYGQGLHCILWIGSQQLRGCKIVYAILSFYF